VLFGDLLCPIVHSMSTTVYSSLGEMLRGTRAGLALSMQDVAQRAGCSAGYVHKLEMNRVRTPSPRVLAGLAEALGLSYQQLMTAAGYEPGDKPSAPGRPGAVKRYSNAHIVELLEALQHDMAELKALLAGRK
jgi:transcriptional regulator with XRE-family HTH domain